GGGVEPGVEDGCVIGAPGAEMRSIVVGLFAARKIGGCFVDEQRVLHCSSSASLIGGHSNSRTAVPPRIRHLSLLKIISGRSDDAIRTELAWRRWDQIVGQLVVSVRAA